MERVSWKEQDENSHLPSYVSSTISLSSSKSPTGTVIKSIFHEVV